MLRLTLIFCGINAVSAYTNEAGPEPTRPLSAPKSPRLIKAEHDDAGASERSPLNKSPRLIKKASDEDRSPTDPAGSTPKSPRLIRAASREEAQSPGSKSPRLIKIAPADRAEVKSLLDQYVDAVGTGDAGARDRVGAKLQRTLTRLGLTIDSHQPGTLTASEFDKKLSAMVSYPKLANQGQIKIKPKLTLCSVVPSTCGDGADGETNAPDSAGPQAHPDTATPSAR